MKQDVLPTVSLLLMYSTAATACKYIIKRTGDLEVYMGNVADTAGKRYSEVKKDNPYRIP